MHEENVDAQVCLLVIVLSQIKVYQRRLKGRNANDAVNIGEGTDLW